MTQKILVLAGRKQSGKSSAANFIAGYALTQLGRKGQPFCPINFTLDEDGNLIVNTVVTDADGQSVAGDGLLDLNRRDDDFYMWASNIMWPHIKLYNFADNLKQIAIQIFGMPADKVYGTNEDKAELTNVKWKDMAQFLPPRTVGELKKNGKYEKKMTIREFLQYFGTNVCRKLLDSCWVDSCLNRVVAEASELAVIGDCRFPNEVKISKKAGAKIIKFTKKVDDDVHESEAAIDKVPDSQFDAVIDNQYMTLKEKNQAILDTLYEWGWLSGYVPMEEQDGQT